MWGKWICYLFGHAYEQAKTAYTYPQPRDDGKVTLFCRCCGYTLTNYEKELA